MRHLVLLALFILAAPASAERVLVADGDGQSFVVRVGSDAISLTPIGGPQDADTSIRLWPDCGVTSHIYGTGSWDQWQEGATVVTELGNYVFAEPLTPDLMPCYGG